MNDKNCFEFYVNIFESEHSVDCVLLIRLVSELFQRRRFEKKESIAQIKFELFRCSFAWKSNLKLLPLWLYPELFFCAVFVYILQYRSVFIYSFSFLKISLRSHFYGFYFIFNGLVLNVFFHQRISHSIEFTCCSAFTKCIEHYVCIATAWKVGKKQVKMNEIVLIHLTVRRHSHPEANNVITMNWSRKFFGSLSKLHGNFLRICQPSHKKTREQSRWSWKRFFAFHFCIKEQKDNWIPFGPSNCSHWCGPLLVIISLSRFICRLLSLALRFFSLLNTSQKESSGSVSRGLQIMKPRKR